MEVAGYTLSDCGHGLIVDEVARRTGGLCGDCHVAAGAPRVRTLEVVGRGVRYQVPIRRNEPKKRKREMTPERRARKKLTEKAATNARKRLAAAMPELYEMFLADERASLGLEPWPLEIALRNKGDAEVELAFAELARELARELA